MSDIVTATLNEQELRNIYYDPAEGYQSREKLYQKAKAKGLKISRRKVKEWLETQDTYTRYKPTIRRHKFQKTYVKELADQIQLDLVDMGKYKHKNKGNYWILTAVEILSRYAFAIPVYTGCIKKKFTVGKYSRNERARKICDNF